MFKATVLCSATSSGQYLYERDDAGPSTGPLSFLHQDQDEEGLRPLGRYLGPFDAVDDDHEAELVWFGKTVVWSRGVEVYRQYTYDREKEDVAHAVFVWFKVGDDGPKTGARLRKRKAGLGGNERAAETFGPFHQSQNEHWGAPRTTSGQGLSSPKLQRTLVVFLQSRAHVYFASGEDITVHLPFKVDGAWALPRGGMLVQRALEKRESRPLGKGRKVGNGSVLRGMMDHHNHNHNHTSTSVLDDLVDLDDNAESDSPLPRLYALENPFDELKMVVQGRVGEGFDHDHPGHLISTTSSLSSSSSILHLTPDPYPFMIAYDTYFQEIIFYRHTRVPPTSEQPSVTPIVNPRTLLPEELLRPPPDPPVQPSTRPRPSLHRNAPSFGASDRRSSGAADPLDRTQRRAPRLSRGPGQEGPVLTDELQATLEPVTMAPPATTTKGRNRGLSFISAGPTSIVPGVSEGHRRTSGAASSFMLQDVKTKQNRMALHLVAERDLRETTMMMGLDRDEAGSRSDVILDKVYTWKVPFAVEPEHISVFTSDNLSSSSVVLNIHLRHPKHPAQLYAFHTQLRSSPYSHFVITPSPPIECLSAVPTISTRPRIFDTLLLSRDGSLKIMTSGGRFIPFDIPQQSGRDDVARQLESMAVHPRRNTKERRIHSLIDAVGSRFTVVYEDGETSRVSTDMRIHHQLTQRCLEALSYVLSLQDFFVVKRETLAAIQALRTRDRHDSLALWRAFSSTLKAMLHIESDQPPRTGFDSLLQDAERSPDPITRRLAARLRRDRPRTQQAPHSAEMTFAESIPPSNTAPIMLALHLVAQDLRLSSMRGHELGNVVKLVSDLASKLGRWDWKDYWARLMPTEISPVAPGPGDTFDTSILDQSDAPPDILTYLSRQLLVPCKPFPSPQTLLGNAQSSEFGLVEPCKSTIILSEVYARLGVRSSRHATDSKDRAASLSQRASATVRYIVNSGLGTDWLADLPYGIVLPILEMIRACQHAPDRTWSPAVYDFIGRADLAIQARGGQFTFRDAQPTLDLDQIPTIGELMSADGSSSSKSKFSEPTLPHVRFGSDRRLQEVERIMQTTRLRTIAVHDPKGASDHDILRNQQNVVNIIANRTLSIPVGQGMFNFGTRSTNITDVWDIPLIELSVKVSPSNTTLKAEILPDSAEWPCFHNGVAAGLAISPDCEGIDSSWIVFNRPNVLNSEHGGFLLGLGLTGHLRSLMTYHAFPLLEPRHDFTSVGLLLGLACSYAGSEDILITKVLSLHTHALLPLGSMELNASPIIQSSALIGLGLVYAGSRNLRMAEVALNEVGRKEMPNVDGFADYQESYSFSAAMAFALIMLGRGGKTTSEVDRRMLAQLRRCILGDVPAQENKTKYTSSNIDINLTGPGATMALGLMYLKTGRKDIADMLEIPPTLYDLDQVRPDLLLLRTFARALIMWEQISPTMVWIEDQLPEFIRIANKDKGQKRGGIMELNTELAYLNIIAGACFAIGLKYAGTAAEQAHGNLMTFFGIMSKAASGQSMTYEGRIRRTAARQCLNIVTLSLSAVMSGTGELNVLRRLRISHGQEGAGVNYGSHTAMHMSLGMLFLGKGHYTLGNSNLSIASMAISFFPRFLTLPSDNKAYPQAFRHLWALAVEPRCLIARDVDTLETVYLPVKLRTRELKGITTTTTSTGKSNLESVVRQQNLISPTLIAPFGSLLSIEVDSPRYWPIIYDLTSERDKQNLIRSRTIYVKRKNGFLDYNSDPKGNRSIFVRAGSMTGIELQYDLLSLAQPPPVPIEEVGQLVRAHSGHLGLVALINCFNEKEKIDGVIRTVLLECISLDKISLIPVYLAVYTALQKQNQSLQGGMDNFNQVLFAKNFYSDIFDQYFSQSQQGEKKAALIRPSFLNTSSRLMGHGDRSVASQSDREIRQAYFLSGIRVYSAGEGEGGSVIGLSKYLIGNKVPPLPLLEGIREKIRSAQQSDLREDILLLKVRDTAERYLSAVEGAYDLQQQEGGTGLGQGWKLDSVREALGVWLE